MCGICGIINEDSDRHVLKDLVVRMRDSMVHRGPDDEGTFLDRNLGLGHRRLSIIDLSERGHQPMSTPDGRYWIVYNGEIYNYRELRPALKAKGIEFCSNTDTEVLLWLYITEGPEMLHRLNGMFAFAIWDTHERVLFAARDRLGVKPFYYALHDSAFYFASEQKAFGAAGLPLEFDQNTWEELLCFRYVSGENTPYVGIRRLLPGHYLIWKDGQCRTARWWWLLERAENNHANLLGRPVENYLQLFDSAVDLRRISDVPLGVFLSGGLDSSSVVASMALQAGPGVNTFNMRFDEEEFDEGELAEEVAKRWHAVNHGLKVPSGDLLSLLEQTSWLNDEPLAHGNDPYLYAIAVYAKPYVTVLLSGEGADETLGGYVRYRPLRYPALLNLSFRLVPPGRPTFGSNGRLGKLKCFLNLGSIEKIILYNTCNILPYQLAALGLQPKEEFPYRKLLVEEAKRYSCEPVRQAMYLDQHTFLCSLLDRNDRMTMGASIECRVPFLDYRLVELSAILPTSNFFGHGQGKWLLRQAMRMRLPNVILRHHKWGFGVPWTNFLRKDETLRQLLTDLPDKEPILSSPLDRQVIRELVDEFLGGSNKPYLLLLQLLMIVIWYEVTFIRKGEGFPKTAQHAIQC
jgi:asparagine synthase (glutamine-hydrolysing)